MAQLRQLLEKQQEQLNKLTQGMLALQAVPRVAPRSARPRVGVCLRCQQPGHYARECDNERFIPQPSAPRVTAVTSALQEAENFNPLM